MIKVGDVLRHKRSDGKNKVLTICGDIYGLSSYNDFSRFGYWNTKTQVEECFDLPKEKWRPDYDENYWFVNASIVADCELWKKYTVDFDRLKAGNCFKTEAEAIIARDKIREVLNGE
jgi:hypothetical protein